MKIFTGLDVVEALGTYAGGGESRPANAPLAYLLATT